MKIKEAIIRYNLLKSISSELPKDLRIKILGYRLELGKIKKSFDEDLKAFSEELLTPSLKEFLEVSGNTSEGQEKLRELNSDLEAYSRTHQETEVEVPEFVLSQDEWSEIMSTQLESTLVIVAGQELSSEDYLEALYNIFM